MFGSADISLLSLAQRRTGAGNMTLMTTGATRQRGTAHTEMGRSL